MNPRKIRMSNNQKNELFAAVVRNPLLVDKKIITRYKRDKLWVELADQLNKTGPSQKSGKDWEQCYKHARRYEQNAHGECAPPDEACSSDSDNGECASQVDLYEHSIFGDYDEADRPDHADGGPHEEAKLFEPEASRSGSDCYAARQEASSCLKVFLSGGGDLLAANRFSDENARIAGLPDNYCLVRGTAFDARLRKNRLALEAIVDGMNDDCFGRRDRHALLLDELRNIDTSLFCHEDGMEKAMSHIF